MTDLSIQHVDTCASCYFQGSPRDVVAVPVRSGMTYRELWRELRDEIYCTAPMAIDGLTDGEIESAIRDCFFHALNRPDTVPGFLRDIDDEPFAELRFSAHCGLGYRIGDGRLSEIRDEAARRILAIRREGLDARTLESGACWEFTDPDDAAMVSDLSGILSLNVFEPPDMVLAFFEIVRQDDDEDDDEDDDVIGD